ncbi:hypothetical protein BJX65DRAFT_300333 [Aspergillus insuetus]
MLSPARAIFRKLHGPTRTESEPAGPPPRAMHISDVRRSPTPTYRRPFPNQTSMLTIVADATGASVDLYKLVRREKDLWEDYPTDDGGAERCKENNVHPLLATVIAAMGEEGDALFIKVSLRTGHRICDAVGLLVEQANGARDQYADNKDGKEQRYKRVQSFQALFPREG